MTYLDTLLVIFGLLLVIGGYFRSRMLRHASRRERVIALCVLAVGAGLIATGFIRS
jgi:hypothetical protein